MWKENGAQWHLEVVAARPLRSFIKFLISAGSFSSQHKNLSSLVWTATVWKWSKSFTHIEHSVGAASSSGASFFARKRPVTGDEPQGTMGRVSRPLSPFRLPLRAYFHLERESSGYEAGVAAVGRFWPRGFNALDAKLHSWSQWVPVLVFSTVWIADHTALKCGTQHFRYVTLHFWDRRGRALLR